MNSPYPDAPPTADADATRPVSEADSTIPHPGLPPGSVGRMPVLVGGYELLTEIARGGMGVVYRARQVGLGREVAVKMILAGGFAGPEAVARFRREAAAAARLDHPHILPVYDIAEHDGHPFFSMKLVTGGTLAGRLAATDRPPLRDLVQLLSQVCQAVDHAHRHGILHRDLKPANVLLDAAGCPYVADFGVAKAGDSTATQTGAVVGTPAYMAPEQARAEKSLTPTADVYSLGAMLFEILAGRPPFRGDQVVDLLLQVVNSPPPHPRELAPTADPALSAIALKCLSKSPADRYPSAAALADDLDRWLAGQTVQARAPRRRWGRREWLLAAGGGTLIAVGAGVAGVLSLGKPADQSLTRVRAAGRLRIGTDPNYPPMEFREDDRLTGFDVELGERLAGRLGVSAEFVEFSWEWSAAIRKLNAGEVDAVISCVTITPERQADAAFVEYLQVSQVFVCRPGVMVANERELVGLRVGVQTDTTGDEVVKRCELAHRIPYEDTRGPFDAIARGEVDVIVADAPVARHFASKEKGVRAMGVIGHTLDPDPVGVVLRRTDTALADAIRIALLDMKQDGARAALLGKWMPP